MIRKFEKFFTREMPLIAVEYWERGENSGLLEVTGGKAHFTPLFIYQKDKPTDVYYDIYNPKTLDTTLISYFVARPDKFFELADKYEKDLAELNRLSQDPKPENFQKIFDLEITTWPMLSVSVVLGGLADKPGSDKVVKRAYNLRYATDKVEYDSGRAIIKMARQIVPKEFKSDVDFLLFNEIKNKKIDKKEVEKRKDGYVYFENKLYVNTKTSDFEKMHNLEILRDSKQAEDIKEIKGSIAMKGNVKGKVKVVMSLDDLGKVEQGDILVASMTTPDHAPALKKAAAFITDEGGITCHAAIVSREMGKPCLIGTKIATRVLKDGMEVEVDADNGIIRVIKRK